MKFDTLSIHAGQPTDPATGALAFPIYQTTSFAYTEPGVHKGFGYSRTENPTRQALETNLAALEGAKYGLAYATGMAAVNGVLATLKSGDHVIAPTDLYGGSYRIFTKLYSKFGISFSFVETSDLEEIRKAARPSTKLLWLESPSNPLLKVTDIAAACDWARTRGITSVVDNTFATPVLQRPIELGADVVLHSTTKYLNGHGDVVGGGLCTSREDLWKDLKFFQNAVGAVPGPQDCFLVLRGIKTLSLRVEKHCANARKVAGFLKEHPKVETVFYPGDPAHPGHAVAKRQMKDFGGIVSFVLKADEKTARAFTTRTKLFTLAESLGSVKSLLCHPPTMTHASVEPEVRRKNGIPDGLVRLSVGIESSDDILADLEQALAAV